LLRSVRFGCLTNHAYRDKVVGVFVRFRAPSAVKFTMENLDSTDLQILKHLQEDSNINIKDLE
jgi:hypothetical protein